MQLIPPANTELHADTKPVLIKIQRPSRRVHIPNVLALVFAVLAVFVLAGVAIPSFGGIQIKGCQTKALAQAKQIGLALRLFANDHNGRYPGQGMPQELAKSPDDSNAAFACLFPTYIQTETIFGNKLSSYQTRQPDNVIDDPYTGIPKETLQPGENVYAYIMGLTDSDQPNAPLVMDGTDGTGHYNTNPASRGGVWNGAKAIVIRLDNSGAIETLAGPDNARFVTSTPPAFAGQAPWTNLLDLSRSGKDLRLLDPAVGHRR